MLIANWRITTIFSRSVKTYDTIIIWGNNFMSRENKHTNLLPIYCDKYANEM